MTKQHKISIVVPVYNESAGLPHFHGALLEVCSKNNIDLLEIIYCDDGSTDSTSDIVSAWHAKDPSIKLLRLSRNFGKEQALAAGIAAAKGDAIITMDSDGQHPVNLLPKFIDAWQNGNLVVIGIRKQSRSDSFIKRIGSQAYYKIYSSVTKQTMLPGTTDYCLIDASVQQAFLKLQEPQRINRALIDWLGFPKTYISFEANKREHGNARYSMQKLVSSAANGLVSMSPIPLYIFGLIGLIITISSLILGVTVLTEQTLLGDPLNWKFTGTAQLSILLLFLVGILLVSQGLLSLYVSHIHNQTKQRPLYVIDTVNSLGINKNDR